MGPEHQAQGGCWVWRSGQRLSSGCLPHGGEGKDNGTEQSREGKRDGYEG